MEKEKINAAIRAAEGNLKHEGMYLIDEERELIAQAMEGNIDERQFSGKILELHTEKYNQIEKALNKNS